jgi:hypothetical protein
VAPSRFSGRPEETAVLDLARRIVARFGLRTTAFMLACRVVPGQPPVLTEIHLDLGGDRILDDLLPASACCDVLEHLVDLLCGPGPDARPVGAPARFRPAGLVFDGGVAPAGARGFTLVRADDPHDLHAAMGMA